MTVKNEGDSCRDGSYEIHVCFGRHGPHIKFEKVRVKHMYNFNYKQIIILYGLYEITISYILLLCHV